MPKTLLKVIQVDSLRDLNDILRDQSFDIAVAENFEFRKNGQRGITLWIKAGLYDKQRFPESEFHRENAHNYQVTGYYTLLYQNVDTVHEALDILADKFADYDVADAGNSSQYL